MHHFRFEIWICLVVLLHILGHQSMTMDSADLWFCPPTSHSVVSDDTGAFGTVCKPIGVDAENIGSVLHPPRGVEDAYDIKLRVSFK